MLALRIIIAMQNAIPYFKLKVEDESYTFCNREDVPIPFKHQQVGMTKSTLLLMNGSI